MTRKRSATPVPAGKARRPAAAADARREPVRPVGRIEPKQASSSHEQRRPRRERAPADPDVVLLWGYHPVREALRSRHRALIRLFATPEGATRVARELADRGVEATVVEDAALTTRLPRDAVHQGLLLETRALPELAVADLPDRGTVIVLDQVTDPHNVGAILRTAAAFGVVGLVVTDRHAPHMTGTLAKAASGGLEHVPIVSVVNLARALEALGDRDFLRIGLDSDGPTPIGAVQTGAAIALVLGAEGKGLRRLTRENCDVVARLDFAGAIRSLNVSNACAVALTELRRTAEGLE